MRRYGMFGVVIASIAWNTAAQGADILRGSILPPPPPPALEPVSGDWSGIYLGVHAGYSWGFDKTAEFFTANGVFAGFAWDYKANSPLLGVHAGVLYEVNRVVVGVEGELELANARGGFDDPIGKGRFHNRWRGSIRGKAGYSFGSVLPYFTFGAAFVNAKYEYTNLITQVVETTERVRLGYTIGAGVSYRMTNNILATMEYRFTDLGNFYFDSVTSFPGLTGRQNPRFSTIRSAISYQF